MIKIRPLPVRPQAPTHTNCFPLPKPPISVKPRPPTQPLPSIDWKKCLGTLSLKDLPKGAQFTNSYFTVDEVKQLVRIANPRPDWKTIVGKVSAFEG
ncbi:MAG: hypothetical protein AB1730_12055 [Myxococcota bacterium]|jgi:hypothetical protein